MSHRRIARRGGALPRALVLLAGIGGCLGAVAYAATPGKPVAAPASPEQRVGTARLPRARITQHPEKVATSASARFGFRARGHRPRFQCRLDRRGWRACRAPVTYNGLATGSHSFAVRVRGKRRRHGRATRFGWQLLEPRDFSIEPQLSGLGALYPGAPALPLPVRISNPNPVPIFVTSVHATATAGPLGCDPAANVILSDSSASSATPLEVPAGGSVNLPAPGIFPPAIQLRDLPVSQDACQNGQFALAFSGEARG